MLLQATFTRITDTDVISVDDRTVGKERRAGAICLARLHIDNLVLIWRHHYRSNWIDLDRQCGVGNAKNDLYSIDIGLVT